MAPTEQRAREAVEEHFEAFSGVEIAALEHVRHAEGTEHRFEFAVSYPQGMHTAELVGEHRGVGAPFERLEIRTGTNDRTRSVLTGTVRCHYGDE